MFSPLKVFKKINCAANQTTIQRNGSVKPTSINLYKLKTKLLNSLKRCHALVRVTEDKMWLKPGTTKHIGLSLVKDHLKELPYPETGCMLRPTVSLAPARGSIKHRDADGLSPC